MVSAPTDSAGVAKMTKDQFLVKVKKLLPDLNNMILEKANKAFDSGAINSEDFENDYLLSKIFLSAIGGEIKSHYAPSNIRYVRLRNNLEKFL